MHFSSARSLCLISYLRFLHVHLCKRCPLFWKDQMFRYVQMVSEEQSNDAQAAVEVLL
jgi:hypothetical protein